MIIFSTFFFSHGMSLRGVLQLALVLALAVASWQEGAQASPAAAPVPPPAIIIPGYTAR